jgi:pilus assembly protein CpaC
MSYLTTRYFRGSRARYWTVIGLFVLFLDPPLGRCQAEAPRVTTCASAREPQVKPSPQPTVQLDVVILHVKPGLARPIFSQFLVNAEDNVKSTPTPNVPLEQEARCVGRLGQLVPQAETPFRGLVRSPRDRENLGTFLDALTQKALVAVLASPTLKTSSGTPGSFLVGGEEALPIPAGLGSIGVQFEEFGTRLNYLPIILGDDRIRLEIEPEVSSLSLANGTVIGDVIVPGRVTNRTHVTVDLKGGQTFVIGGLIEHRVETSTKRTPVLGGLPFVGPFFTSTSQTMIAEEVVIMVTPTISADNPRERRTSNDGSNKLMK